MKKGTSKSFINCVRNFYHRFCHGRSWLGGGGVEFETQKMNINKSSYQVATPSVIVYVENFINYNIQQFSC